MTMSYRVRYRTLGGHVHAHFWSSEFGPETTHGGNGRLIFRVGEDWEYFKRTLLRGAADTPGDDAPVVTFIDETHGGGITVDMRTGVNVVGVFGRNAPSVHEIISVRQVEKECYQASADGGVT